MSELASNWEREQVGERAYRQTFHLRPIAHLKAGAYQRITNALGASGDPALSVGVDELVQFRIRDRIAGESPLLFFGKGANSIRMTPLDTNNCTGVVSGNSITFPNARKGADLRLTIGGHRLETEWLLKAGHPSVFAWRLDSHTGFDPDTLDCGTFRFLPPVLVSPDGLTLPLAWAVSTSGGKYVLTCVLPEGDYAGWTLDPTLTTPQANTILCTYMEQHNATSNYGGSANLLSRGNATFLTRPVLKFDLSSASGATAVTASTLHLFRANQAFGNTTSAIDVYRILVGNSSITELGMTWNTQDGAAAWAGSAGCSTAGTDRAAASMGTISVVDNDVIGTDSPGTLSTAETLTMIGANYGMVIVSTYNGDTVWWCSDDHATAGYRPYWVIDYTEAAAGLSIPVAMAHYARLRR